MDGLKGREFVNVTKGELDSDGYWRVIVTITEKIQINDQWFEESIDAMGIDRTWDEAHKTALKSVLGWLGENVYDKGFDNLVLAMAFQREQEENGKLVTDNNKDTPS
jgi:hypothetical protein